jgi:hypothetical protein
VAEKTYEFARYKLSWIPTGELDNGTASVLPSNEGVLAISSGNSFTIRGAHGSAGIVDIEGRQFT